MPEEKKHVNTDPDFLRVQNRKVDKAAKLASKEETLAERLDIEGNLTYAYHEFFKKDSGKLILADLEKAFKYKNSCYSPDERGTVFALGQQSTLIYIHDKINRELKETK